MKLTIVANKYLVSTVHLPAMHVGGDYETMVFPVDANGEVTDWSGLEQERYYDEAAADAGHAAMCSRYESESAS